jgi:hypothetical protein
MSYHPLLLVGWVVEEGGALCPKQAGNKGLCCLLEAWESEIAINKLAPCNSLLIELLVYETISNLAKKD